MKLREFALFGAYCAILFNLKVIPVYATENELGLCDIGPPKTNCDLRSTHCVNRNASENYFACKCKYGYTESKPPSPIYCDDVDECTLFKKNGMTDERCVHGICINQYGDWNCSCPADRLWMSVGQDVATYRCQGNYTYLGTVSFSILELNMTTSKIDSFLLTELRRPLQSNESIAVANNTSIAIRDVFVNLTVSKTFQEKIVPYILHNYSYEFEIRLGEPISTDSLELIMKMYFNKNRTVNRRTTYYNFDIFNDSDNKLCIRNNNSECDMASTVCRQSNGQTYCVCKYGYERYRQEDVFTCQDINECNEQKVSCKGGGTCLNLPGNWTCACPPLTEPVIYNTSYIECSKSAFNVCAVFKAFKCLNGDRACENNTWTCNCNDGFELYGTEVYSTCTDIDECSNDNYLCNGSCLNTPGGWTCNCPTGYTAVTQEEFNILCFDINECDSSPCGNGTCKNTNGSFACTCDSGFMQENSTSSCIDIDECYDNNHTCNGGTCHNHMGSWNCECPNGFKNNTSADGLNRSCSDINECETEPNTCIDSIECINTPGSWRCTCDGKRVSMKINDTSIECQKDFQYIASVIVNFNPDKTPKQTEIESYLPLAISNVFNCSELTSPIFVPIEITNSSREELVKWLSGEKLDMSIEFILHLTHPANTTTIQKAWSSVLNINPILRTVNTNISATALRLSVELDASHAETKGLCTISSLNYCNGTRSVCSDSNGQIQCNCRPGYDKETLKNKTCVPKEDKKDVVAFLCTVSFSMDTNGTNYTTIKLEVKTQITLVYEKMFPNVSFWIEVINISKPSRHRRKRSETKQTYQTVEFITHFEQTNTVMTVPEINKTMWEKYVNETLSETNSVLIKLHTFILKPAEQTDLCNISHMCDIQTTTCTSTSSKIKCTCKEGYINNTRNNEMFQCSWADPTRSQPTQTRSQPTQTTTTEQPDMTTKYIEPDPQKSQTALIATGAGLGGLVLILLVVIVVVCRRQRTHKEKEAKQIQLKEREKKRQTGFEGSFVERNYTGRPPGSEHRNGGPYPSGPFKPISNGRTSPFKPVDTATGRVFQVPEPKAASPPPDNHRRNRSRDRPNMSRDSGLNGFNSSGSMESTRSRDSHVYESLQF